MLRPAKSLTDRVHATRGICFVFLNLALNSEEHTQPGGGHFPTDGRKRVLPPGNGRD